MFASKWRALPQQEPPASARAGKRPRRKGPGWCGGSGKRTQQHMLWTNTRWREYVPTISHTEHLSKGRLSFGEINNINWYETNFKGKQRKTNNPASMNNNGKTRTWGAKHFFKKPSQDTQPLSVHSHAFSWSTDPSYMNYIREKGRKEAVFSPATPCRRLSLLDIHNRASTWD